MIAKEDLIIPYRVLRGAGLHEENPLLIMTNERICLVRPAKLTAEDVVQHIGLLGDMVADLTELLADTCGCCDNCGAATCCGTPTEWVGNCDVVTEILESGDSQLFNLPDELFITLLEHGVCLAELESLLEKGAIVHAG